MTLTVGSLFSGIGGLDLGLERAGMHVIWQSEIDPYACRVLAKHWPDTPNLGDITAIDWSTVERPDVICGGYPCQPFSYAGARAGTDDRRHLWPYFLDAIRKLRPRYALLENVPGHLSLGFGRVLGDLAESGYDAQWDCIPAAAVGAPHRRDRVFVVAHTNSESEPGRAPHASTQRLMVQDANGERLEGSELQRQFECFSERPSHSSWWAVEPPVGRVADGVPERMGQLHALGNAVVPQVAEWIGQQILAAEQTLCE